MRTPAPPLFFLFANLDLSEDCERGVSGIWATFSRIRWAAVGAGAIIALFSSLPVLDPTPFISATASEGDEVNPKSFPSCPQRCTGKVLQDRGVGTAGQKGPKEHGCVRGGVRELERHGEVGWENREMKWATKKRKKKPTKFSKLPFPII